jgi:hypothetical protein
MQKTARERLSGTYHIVETYGPALKEDLSGPAGVYGVPKFNYVQANVLVKAVEYQFAHSRVIPRTVNKEQPRQKSELKHKYKIAQIKFNFYGFKHVYTS